MPWMGFFISSFRLFPKGSTFAKQFEPIFTLLDARDVFQLNYLVTSTDVTVSCSPVQRHDTDDMALRCIYGFFPADLFILQLLFNCYQFHTNK